MGMYKFGRDAAASWLDAEQLGAARDGSFGGSTCRAGMIELNRRPGRRRRAGSKPATTTAKTASIGSSAGLGQFSDQLNVNNALLLAETTGLIDLNGFHETIVGPGTNSMYTRWAPCGAAHGK